MSAPRQKNALFGRLFDVGWGSGNRHARPRLLGPQMSGTVVCVQYARRGQMRLRSDRRYSRCTVVCDVAASAQATLITCLLPGSWGRSGPAGPSRIWARVGPWSQDPDCGDARRLSGADQASRCGVSWSVRPVRTQLNGSDRGLRPSCGLLADDRRCRISFSDDMVKIGVALGGTHLSKGQCND